MLYTTTDIEAALAGVYDALVSARAGLYDEYLHGATDMMWAAALALHCELRYVSRSGYALIRQTAFSASPAVHVENDESGIG